MSEEDGVGWSCRDHGGITPLWRAEQVGYDEFHDHLQNAAELPTWLLWPLPAGWAVNDFGCVVRPGGEQLPLTVLCLDNDETILDGMRALLGRWGVDCRVALDAHAALDILSTTHVDLILADYHLGEGMDGLEALQYIGSKVARVPPAAMVTADGSTELKQRARSLGYPLLHKPVRPAALRALLVALVKRTGTHAA